MNISVVRDWYGATKNLRERHHCFGGGYRECADAVLDKVVEMFVVVGIKFNHEVEAAAHYVTFRNFGNSRESFYNGVDVCVGEKTDTEICDYIKSDSFGVNETFGTDYHFILKEALNALVNRSTGNAVFASYFKIGCTGVCCERVEDGEIEIVEKLTCHLD